MFFKVSDLIERLTEISNDGYETVELDLIEPEEDLPGCITFSVDENEFLQLNTMLLMLLKIKSFRTTYFFSRLNYLIFNRLFS